MKRVFKFINTIAIALQFQVILVLVMFFHVQSIAQPSVVTQPRDTAVCVETTIGFHLVAVNTVGYQWQEYDGMGWYNLDGSFIYVSGQNTPNLTIIDANLALNGYKYRCVVRDINNLKDTSRAANLGVFDPPIILQNPGDDRVCKNQIAIFSIQAQNGTHYRWQEKNNAGWIDLENNSFYSGVFTPDLSIYTVLGMNTNRYRCIVTNVSCPDTTISAGLMVDPTPVAFSVTGGGSFCAGDQGLPIGLSGSEVSVTYNLLLDGIETGVVRSGTGGPIDFGLQSLAGTYTVRAYNQFTPCSALMNDQTLIVINPPPTSYVVQGGGEVCAGEEGPAVFLLSSQNGVQYELYLNAQTTGMVLTGTGYGLTFGPQQQSGVYTIIATNPVQGCSSQMTGQVTVTIHTLPGVYAGSDQVINQGEVVQLSGTVAPPSGSYSYRWTPQNLCVKPQLPVTNTHPLFVSTLFSFEATNLTTGCISPPDTCIVFVRDGALSVQILQSASEICIGEQVQLTAIAGGGNGSYTYQWTSSPPGFLSNTANPIVSPTENTVYHLVLSDGTQSFNRSVSIEVFALPQQFNLSGGGNYCQGQNGISITLSGSQQGVVYSLYHNQLEVATMTGTGQLISFGRFTDPGNYTATAENGHGCTQYQNGQAVVGIKAVPIAEAGLNQQILSGQSTTLNGSATGGTPPYQYSWSPADSLINATSPTPATVLLRHTQLYSLQVTDANTCVSAPDNMVVIVTGGALSLSVFTSGYPICPGTPVTLYAMATGGTGSFTYFWQSNPPGFTSTLYSPVVNPVVTTTYTVIVNDGFQVVTSSVTVEVNASPYPFTVEGGGSVCQGNNSDDITLSGSESNTQYRLFRNGTFTGGIKNGDGFALNFGNQTLDGAYTVFAIRNSTLCSNPMNSSAIIAISPLPIVNAGPDQLIGSGTSTTLSGLVTGGSGTYDYQWQPSSWCLSPQSLNTTTISLSQSSLFTFRAVDQSSQCVSKNDTVVVFVQGGQGLMIRASATPGVVCQGDGVNLKVIPSGGTGNYQITWSSNPVGFYSASTNAVAYPQVSTTYYVQVYDGVQHAYDTVDVGVLSPPAAYTVTGGGGYCAYNTGVTVGLSGSQTGMTYTLMLEPNQEIESWTGTGQALSFSTVSTPGHYFVQARNGAGCTRQMNGQAVVEVFQPPVANAGPDKIISQAMQAVLEGAASSGSGFYQYRWTPSDSLLTSTSQTPQTVPLFTTNVFNLVATDAITGCISQPDNMVVMVTGGPFTLTIMADATIICPGEEIQLFALASGGNGTYTYSWSASPVGFTSNLMAPWVSPSQTTTYTVSVSDGLEIRTSSIIIRVNPLPTGYTVSGGGTVCEGIDPDAITLSGSQLNYTYHLLYNGAITGVTRTGNGFPLQFGTLPTAGNYSVIAIENQLQCVNAMAGNAVVIVNPLPVADGGPDKIIPENTSAVLTGSVTNGGTASYQYLWQPQALTLSPHASATQTTNLTQSALFKFSATNLQSGCSSLHDTVYVFTIGNNLVVDLMASSLSACAGEQVGLTALASGGTGNYTYSWTSVPSGMQSALQSIQVHPQVTTTYIVEVFDGENLAYDTLVIQVEITPAVFTVTGGGGFCPDEDGAMVGLSGSESGVQYELLLNPQQTLVTLTGTGQALTFGNYTQAGHYTVIANSQATCSSAMNGSVEIISHTGPSVQAGADQTVPSGTRTLLRGSATGGSGFYDFAWQPAGMLVNPLNREALTVPMNQTTLFTLGATDYIFGCEGNPDQVVVFVTGGPLQVDVYSNIEQVCAGETVELYALPTGGTGNYSYLWLSNPAGFSATTYHATATPTVSTWYKVTVSDGVNIVTDSVIINVLTSPTGFDLTGGGLSCQGVSAPPIELTGSETETTYQLWNDQQGALISVPGSGNAISFGSCAQEGYYWAIASHNHSGCYRPMNDTVVVQVIEQPLADAGMDQYIQSGTATQLFGTASGGGGTYGFNWAPPYLLNNPTLQQPQTVPLNLSTNFFLNINDLLSGCTSQTDQTTIYVLGGPLSVVISASPGSLCEGESAWLEAIPSGGSGNYSYLWTSIPAGMVSNSSSPVVHPGVSTQYCVRVQDGINTVFDTILIEVYPHPQVYLLTGGGSFCAGNQGPSIYLSGSQQGVQYTLYRNNIAVAQKSGTGLPIDFGHFTPTGLYSAEAVFSGSGCQVTMAGSALVNKNQLPTVDAGPDRIIAQGGTTTLDGSAGGGSGDYQYRWSPAIKLLNASDPDATTIPLNTTTLFTLEVEDVQTGCIGQPSNAVVFVSGGALQVDIVASTLSVCPGEQIRLYALPGGGTGYYTYFWESSPAGFYATGQEALVSPLQPTWYKVTITNGAETAADSILITPYQLPQKFTLAGGGDYCAGGEGAPVFLENSTPSVSYELYYQTQPTGTYQTGTGSSLDFGAFFAPGNYSVVATSTQGCTTEMANSVAITVADNPIAYQLVGGGTYCSNDPTLGLLLESSQTNTSYSLLLDATSTGMVKQGTGLPLSFGGLPESGIYSVVATHDLTGCTSVMSGSIPYVIYPIPEVAIVGDTVLCSGDTIVLQGTGALSYEWNTIPPQFTSSIRVSPEVETQYMLVGENSHGCYGAASSTVSVNERPQISLVNDVNSWMVTVYPEGLDEYIFLLAGEVIQRGVQNSWSYSQYVGPTDTLLVIGTSHGGCSTEARTIIEVEEAPNAFTPNGDGKNDMFLQGIEITVFSSWGGELYHGDEGWDGKYNGELVVPGTYYYVRPVYDRDGSLIKTIKGSVTVVKE